MKHRSHAGAIFLLLLLLAGCATREPGPQELQSKRFETTPGKAVVYLFRDRLDFSRAPVSLMLDGQGLGGTYAGTYYRLELAPGRHRVAGFADDSGAFEFTVAAGRLYFFRHSVSRFMGFDRSAFFPVDETQGRYAVLQYEYLGNNGIPVGTQPLIR